MWASGFSSTTLNSGSSKTNKEVHEGMRLFTYLIRLTCSSVIRHSFICYSFVYMTTEQMRMFIFQAQKSIYSSKWVQIHILCSKSVSLSSCGLFKKLDRFIFESRAHHIKKTISRLFCCCSEQRFSSF